MVAESICTSCTATKQTAAARVVQLPNRQQQHEMGLREQNGWTSDYRMSSKAAANEARIYEGKSVGELKV